MTHIDVMKQALEALNTLPCGDSYKTHNAQVQLRKAIEESEKNQFYPDWNAVQLLSEENLALHKRIAELEAEKVEPVGIVNQAFGGVEWLIDWSKTPLPDDTPLYTATSQREWIGLTDEEIDEGQRHSWVEKQAFESAEWWAEEKLKEKNS